MASRHTPSDLRDEFHRMRQETFSADLAADLAFSDAVAGLGPARRDLVEAAVAAQAVAAHLHGFMAGFEAAAKLFRNPN